MAKCCRDQSLEPPPEIKQALSILFGQQPRFSVGSSGSSSKSPRSSKSARPSKSPRSMSRDASVSDARGPSPASEFQKKKVEEAVSQMVTDKVLHLSDLYDVVSCFSSCEATATLFLGFSSTDRLSEVNTFLLTKKWNRQIYSECYFYSSTDCHVFFSAIDIIMFQLLHNVIFFSAINIIMFALFCLSLWFLFALFCLRPAFTRPNL